jgi:hypothetical protein
MGHLASSVSPEIPGLIAIPSQLVPDFNFYPKKTRWTGWWWLEHDFNDFPFSWEYIIIPTVTKTPLFFRGVGQLPPTRLLLFIINHIITIDINHYYQYIDHILNGKFCQASAHSKKPPVAEPPFGELPRCQGLRWWTTRVTPSCGPPKAGNALPGYRTQRGAEMLKESETPYCQWPFQDPKLEVPTIYFWPIFEA